MKVMCINTSPDGFGPDEAPFNLKFGEVYNVVDEEIDEDDVLWYELMHDLGIVYNSELFIPCSDIDETELVNEEVVCY